MPLSVVLGNGLEPCFLHPLVVHLPTRMKLDPSPDRGWYEQPRFVHHVDDRFRRQVTELYRQRIPHGAGHPHSAGTTQHKGQAGGRVR